MSEQIDLHMHTNCSDGVHSPAELLTLVRNKKLAAFSVTDHDTLSGYDAICPMLRESDPELVPGIELSATVGDNDMHILAYLFDPKHNGLRLALNGYRTNRKIRAAEMVNRLCELGLSITMEDVEETTNGSAIGRPHIAETLFRLGQTTSYIVAFQKYIGYGGPAYVPRIGVTPSQAIKVIHDAGGLAVMAHPEIANMYKHIESLVADGLDGIELLHYANSENSRQKFSELASRFELVVTGGSDFHGRSRRDADIGSQNVPLSYLEQLKHRANQLS